MNTWIFWMFDTPILTRFIHWYRRVFSIKELEEQRTLTWVLGATLLSYHVTFYDLITSGAVAVNEALRGNATCWSYFQNCEQYYFLYSQPYGYSQALWYMCLMGILMLIVYCMHKREWIAVHMLLLLPYTWHALTTFLLTGRLAGNFDYYLFAFTTTLLFLAHKEYFLKLLIVLFYFLSTATKIHEAWVVAGYFGAMQLGLPIFPEWTNVFLTNQLIFMEMVGAWFLLSNRPWLQRSVAAYFIFFHLYSGIIVWYRYPTVVLPTLIIVFALFYRYQDVPLDKKSITGWAFIAIICAIQSLPYFIPGDQKFTLEGNRYGVYMFESNHQCVSTEEYQFKDGTKNTKTRMSSSSRNRCDPFDYLQKIQHFCANRESNVASVRWTFDHSINGNPFRRQVDSEDACLLRYKKWGHNEWIRFEHDAPIVGYPKENWMY